MTIARTTRALILLGAAAVVIAVQVLQRCPRASLLWSALFDAGHVPLYGLVALALLYASLTFVSRSGRPRLWHYLAALAVTMALGAIAEGLQALGKGDASLADFLRDAAGSTAFLMVALAFDAHPIRGTTSEDTYPAQGEAPPASNTRFRRVVLLVAAVALLAVALSRVTTVAIAYLQRNAAFPVLCDFEGAWEGKFVHVRDAELEIGFAPAGWGREASDNVARITFEPAVYPALLINEPFPDWRGYDRLVVEVYSELDSTVSLVLRIDDVLHDNAYSDRFNRRLVIEPGVNRISIPLADVERAPRARKMDMGRVRNVVLFAVRPAKAFSVWVDGVRVERE